MRKQDMQPDDQAVPEAPDFISAAECTELAKMLDRKYASQLQQRRFEVKATKDGHGVYATVTLRNDSGSFYYPVEARLAHGDHELSTREGVMMLLDYIDSYFDEYLREGDVFLPIDWTAYECEGIPFQLKGQIFNLEVERLADEWLKAADESEAATFKH